MSRKALEALQEARPGKSESGDSLELPKVDSEVAEGLQNELGNLKTENEYLRQKLAESLDTVETLNWGTEALKEQLEAGRAEHQRLQNDLGNSQAEVTELRSQLEQERADRKEVEAQLTDRGEQLRQLLSELSELKQKSATSSELPEAAEILNQLKVRRKKSNVTLGDIEEILAMIEES